MSESHFDEFDEAHGLQEEYDHLFQQRSERRERRVRKSQIARRFREETSLEAIADLGATDGALRITYQPSIHESGWLLDSLRQFFNQELISDLLYIVKGGKEANVYCCQAGPATGRSHLAVKVYRPHQFRKIRNDAQYKEGRHVLDAGGNAIVNDQRTFRALAKKSRHGRETARVSWLAHEYETQQALFQAGAAVPEPLAMANNAILMEFVGDGRAARPTLSQVELAPDEVWPLFSDVLRTVEALLRQGKIHGDLSAYNILYWQGAVKVIDFPQVVDAQQNASAAELLLRDITRVCDYFRRQGLPVNAAALTDALWRTYVGPAGDNESDAIDLATFRQPPAGVDA